MNMRTAGLLAAATLTGWALQAEPTDEKPQQMQDVVVSAATLQETSVEKLGQSITVISREEIEASKLTYVKDYLRRVPGLNMRSNGPNGNTSVSVRGLQPYHTKLLIDGVPYQDATGTQVLPILNTLRVEDVERIEIVRGASSTVNGSNAIGGVINIVTRGGKDAGKPVAGSLGAEYGSHGRQSYSGSLRGANGPVDYAVSAAWTGERGISAMNDLPANGDDDPFRSLNLSGRVGMDLAEGLRIEGFGRFTDADQEYDIASLWGPFVDSGDVHQQEWLVGGRLIATDLIDGLLDSSLSLSYSEARRSYRDEAGWSMKDRFTGTTLDAKWLNTFHIAEGYDLTVGVENTRESAKTIDGGIPDMDEKHSTWAYLAEIQAEPIANLFLNAGARYNDHSLFGHETTWSASARYLVEASGTTLKASAGKAYRAPSFYELYGPYGDSTIEPETSQNWEVGLEQDLFAGSVTVGSTYYEARINNYIGWDPTAPPWGGYNQISGLKVHGVESFIRYRPMESLDLYATHTYQHTNSMDTDLSPVAYRPSQMATLGATYTGCGDRLTIDLNANFVGSRRTADGTGGMKLESYCLMALAVSYDLTENLEIYGRIENLLNDGYETNPGYNTLGRCYYAGLKYSF